MLRKRLIGILAVLPLVVVLGAVAYKFGPSPTGKAKQESLPPAANPEPPETRPVASSSRLFNSLGITEKAVAAGRVAMTTSQYLDSIESLYRQRGYQKLDAKYFDRKVVRRLAASKNHEVARKFFRREENGEVNAIFAVGTDADYGSDQEAAEPFGFNTFVTKVPGGAEWAAFRVEVDRKKLEQLAELEHGDFPGSDPPNIPRPQGLQRIYAMSSPRGSVTIYSSRSSEDLLTVGYLKEMPRHGWRLDPEFSANASKAARGVMAFTQGARLCLIWVTANKGEGITNVTISSN
jgi:hypothetical protein